LGRLLPFWPTIPLTPARPNLCTPLSAVVLRRHGGPTGQPHHARGATGLWGHCVSPPAPLNSARRNLSYGSARSDSRIRARASWFADERDPLGRRPLFSPVRLFRGTHLSSRRLVNGSSAMRGPLPDSAQGWAGSPTS
jgi:hypothetical protein